MVLKKFFDKCPIRIRKKGPGSETQVGSSWLRIQEVSHNADPEPKPCRCYENMFFLILRA